MSDYARLTEEVQVLNKLKLNNPQNEDLISEMISVINLSLIRFFVHLFSNSVIFSADIY